jgi:hypothetical protein
VPKIHIDTAPKKTLRFRRQSSLIFDSAAAPSTESLEARQ